VPGETPSIFAKIIEDHLKLKRRNAALDLAMPIAEYKSDLFDNRLLLKTEEQALLEEPERALWGRAREFDWGD
jgi:hypothetical protein